MRKSILLACLCAVPTVNAAPIYTEDFEIDQTANWTFRSSIALDTANDNLRNEANFFFDYSTVGIPLAPHSTGTTTRGLKMEANIPGTGTFSGMSASPTGVALGSGDLVIRFDAWQNFNGGFPGGGSGSTQVTLAGFGTDGTKTIFPGAATWNSVAFGATADGGSGVDYRAYLGNSGFTGTAPTLNVLAGSTQPDAQKNPDGTPVFAAGAAAGSSNNTNAYYNAFGGVAAPSAQSTLFPQQIGSTAVGALGMAWHYWEITREGTRLTWKVDGKLLATVDTTMNPSFNFDGTNLLFGYFDINGTSSTDANARNLLFGLIDNVSVVAIPEPGSLSLLALSAMPLLRRRRA